MTISPAGLFIALTGLTRWQHLAMGGLIFALYVIYRTVEDRTKRTLRISGLLILAGLLALLIMAPLLAPLAYGQLERDNPDALFVNEEPAYTDLLAYLLPSRYQPWWGKRVFGLYQNLGVNKVLVPFIGFAVLLLAIIGVVSSRTRSRFWLLASLVLMILALGPQLTVNGHLLPGPLPYRLVEDWFIVPKPWQLFTILTLDQVPPVTDCGMWSAYS